jgi:hypothetical protein
LRAVEDALHIAGAKSISGGAMRITTQVMAVITARVKPTPLAMAHHQRFWKKRV